MYYFPIAKANPNCIHVRIGQAEWWFVILSDGTLDELGWYPWIYEAEE